MLNFSSLCFLQRSLLALCFILCCSTSQSASTNATTGLSYPIKSIRLIVPFPAGGGVDAVARLFATKLSERINQQILIDNRGGSGGIIAAEIAARAAPDGYTLFFGGSASHGITPNLYRKLPYDPVLDFLPTSFIGEVPYFLVIHPTIPAQSVRELIALAQSRPGQLNYASAGNGSTLHLAGELFKSKAGIQIVHVPYKGGAPALTDLLGGIVQMAFNPPTLTLPYVKAGRLKVLGVTSAKRVEFAPDVPTMNESGVAGYRATGWYGLLGPKQLKPMTNQLLHTRSQQILSDKEFKDRFSALGGITMASSSIEFSNFIKSELAQWAQVVRDSSARVD
jgi:tripartite-type tricarboxylate transporter receptor subunit TctC